MNVRNRLITVNFHGEDSQLIFAIHYPVRDASLDRLTYC